MPPFGVTAVREGRCGLFSVHCWVGIITMYRPPDDQLQQRDKGHAGVGSVQGVGEIGESTGSSSAAAAESGPIFSSG